jgi:hypothetical protein
MKKKKKEKKIENVFLSGENIFSGIRTKDLRGEIRSQNT